jgi:exodeoxyribonuclease VII small subunit
MSEKKVDFKKEIARLDEIVDEVSSKTLSLDESLKLYEEGMKIIKQLEGALKAAEEKVEQVVSIEDK